MLKLFESKPSSSLSQIESPQIMNSKLSTSVTTVSGMPTGSSSQQADDYKFEFFTRIKLDVTINAPLIVVPESMTSSNALLLDCGVVTMRTSLSVLKNYYRDGLVGERVDIDPKCLNDRCQLPPVIEIQKVTLSKMEISK